MSRSMASTLDASAPDPSFTLVERAHAPNRSERRPAYVLVSEIPVYTDAAGDLFVDDLWARDLQAHFDYIPRLRLAAPTLPLRPEHTVTRVEVPAGVEFELVALPSWSSWRDVSRGLPRLLSALWRATEDAGMVHSAVAGWPIPIGWLANLVARARGIPLMIVVESAPWRIEGPSRRRQRIRAGVMEAAARYFVGKAELAIFTQAAYRDSLRGSEEGSLVAPATWVEAEDMVGPEAAVTRWRTKPQDRLRVFLPTRLVAAKGVTVLLDALRKLDARGIEIDVDIMGKGSCRADCIRASRELERVRLRVLDPVAYGPTFFETVRGYHAVLVPSLADEQPRIVFDAFAQAVPVVASDTDGLRSVVADGETGWLVPKGDATALADLLERMAARPASCAQLGLRALAWARGATHQAMHARRARWIDAELARSVVGRAATSTPPRTNAPGLTEGAALRIGA